MGTVDQAARPSLYHPADFFFCINYPKGVSVAPQVYGRRDWTRTSGHSLQGKSLWQPTARSYRDAPQGALSAWQWRICQEVLACVQNMERLCFLSLSRDIRLFLFKFTAVIWREARGCWEYLSAGDAPSLFKRVSLHCFGLV